MNTITKAFKLNEIVNISPGNDFNLQEMTFENPKVNFISRTERNNGVIQIVDHLKETKPFKKNSITIALGGSIGATFFQDQPFYTAQNIVVLRFNKPISFYAKLYLCQIIKFEARTRFCAFGRELNKHIKNDFSVRLPVKNNGDVDWLAMEKYMKSLCNETIIPKSKIIKKLLNR